MASYHVLFDEYCETKTHKELAFGSFLPFLYVPILNLTLCWDSLSHSLQDNTDKTRSAKAMSSAALSEEVVGSRGLSMPGVSSPNFCNSSEISFKLRSSSSQSTRRRVMELRGKNPTLVFQPSFLGINFCTARSRRYGVSCES